MKHAKLIAVFLVLVVACKCNNDQPATPVAELVIPDTLLVYDVDPSNKTMHRFTEVPDSAFTVQRVINGLNQKYPDVQLQLLKQQSDTVYVSVPESEVVGERMGSTGAGTWFADVVLNLTAVNGVRFVNITMEEGSHASSGVFKKEDFPAYTEAKDSIPAI